MYCVHVKSKTLSRREKNSEDGGWSEGEGARFWAYLTSTVRQSTLSEVLDVGGKTWRRGEVKRG